MFHPGLPVAEPASWAQGLRRDPGIRCCAAVPPPSQADVTAAAREALLLRHRWSVRTGRPRGLRSPTVGRTLFGLPSLSAGAFSWWFLALPGLGGLGCQEFLLAFRGKVVPLCLQVLCRPWFGCLTDSSVKVYVCACMCMCAHVLHPGRGPRRIHAACLAPACLISGPHFFGPWLCL